MQAQKNKNIEPPAKKYKKPDGHDIKVYLTDIFVVELFLNEIAGIHSTLATLLKRSHHRGGFLVNALEFSVFPQKGLT